jgi:hypothetical protein
MFLLFLFFFLGTNTHCRHLRAIWNLADNDKDGKLTAEEFAVAMYIINQCNTTKNPPPATLPADLIPPSQRPR